jgi:hypothetical protein
VYWGLIWGCCGSKNFHKALSQLKRIRTATMTGTVDIGFSSTGLQHFLFNFMVTAHLLAENSCVEKTHSVSGDHRPKTKQKETQQLLKSAALMPATTVVVPSGTCEVPHVNAAWHLPQTIACTCCLIPLLRYTCIYGCYAVPAIARCSQHQLH